MQTAVDAISYAVRYKKSFLRLRTCFQALDRGNLCLALTLNFYNMSNRKNYAAPEMQSFEVNAEAGFALSKTDSGAFGEGGHLN